MKPKEIDQIIETIITSEVKRAFLKENKEKKYEVYQVTCEGEPVECFKSMDEAEEHVDKLKKDHPGKQFIIEKKSYESYGDMIDELENMGEQLEEKENQNMENQEPKEGNAFAYAALKAKKAGKKTFEFGGEKHDVEECWKQLEEEETSGWNEEEECQECGSEMKEQKEKMDITSIWEKYSEDAYSKNSPSDFSDEFEYADNVLNHIVQNCISDGICSEEDEDDLKDKLKFEYGHDLLDEYRNGGDTEEESDIEEKLFGGQNKLDFDKDGEIEASDLAKLRSGEKSVEEDSSLDGVVKKLYSKIHSGDQSMEEEKKVCEKCGKELCECGIMNESKKKVLRLTETELMSFIKNIINESVPGLEVVKKAKSDDKGTKEHLSDVEKKMKDYLSFDGNDNPEFPKAVGKGEVVARQADEKESDEVADQRGGGLEDLNYDVEPSEKFKERLKKALEGDSTMGNSQEAAGVIKTDTGKKLGEKVKRKDKKEEEAPMYHKDPQPVKKLSESKVTFEGIVKEEIEKMKKLSSYNKKTQ